MNVLKFRVYKLRFKSSLHIGTREGFTESTEFLIHSDTIFSAFCNGYLLLYGKERLERLLKEFVESTPPFLISSAFPFWNSKYYFPIPLNQIPAEKETKKILFIEKQGFEMLLRGESIEKVKEKIDFIKESAEKPWKVMNTPRVGLSRWDAHPHDNFFHFGEVFFKDNSGLFFLTHFNDSSLEKEFTTTLRLLGDEGIGGDRTVGKGLFCLEEDEMEIKIPESKAALTLSLYFPQENELNDIKNGFYEILERRGYIYSPFNRSLRKKTVRMFKEGSVFPNKKIGKVADVTPEIFTQHRVYRYGLAFNVPCVLEVNNEN